MRARSAIRSIAKGRWPTARFISKPRADVALLNLRRALTTVSRVHFAAGRSGSVSGARARHDASARRRCARADPAPSKTDLDRRVHDVANVLVIGATSFTRYIRANLQMMSMAMAHYDTEHDPF